MTKLSVYNNKRDQVGEKEFPDSVFSTSRYEHLFHELVRAHLAARRAGTASTKTRSERSGGGKKPWRQKGTGRARQGSTRSTQWVGGGRPHGPKPRKYDFAVPKKVRKAALRSALSRRVREESLFLLESFGLDAPRTKDMKAIVERFGGGRVLIILKDKDENIMRSAANLIGVTVRGQDGVSVYDVLRHGVVLSTVEAAQALSERLAS